MKLDVIKWPKGEGNIPIATCVEIRQLEDGLWPELTPPDEQGREFERMEVADFIAWREANKLPDPEPVESFEEKRDRILQDAQAIYSAQPVQARAAFLTMYAAAKIAVREGDFAAAKQLIVEAEEVVPSQLEPVRQQLLALFE